MSPIVRSSNSSPSKLSKNGSFFKNYLDIRKRLQKTFVNRTPLLSVGPKNFTILDAVAAGIQSKTHMYLVGSRGSAKTVLASTIMRSVFNDQGFHLRGDINLQLKDLFVKLNLDGKTEKEIYKIAETTKFLFALIDELNRIPGVLQNQFLNIADGYIEIRGKKYSLGMSDYMLMVATANPATNGEYTGVFDEDLALLDRISLIINTDEVELARGDVAKISEIGIEKNTIPLDDLSSDVVSSYSYLRDQMRNDPEVSPILSLLMEMVYRDFRFVEVDQRLVDKAKEPEWRDKLSGQHGGGLVMSHCSDISVRTLKHSARLAFTMYKIAEIESQLHKKAGIEGGSIGITQFIQAYMESLKLALNYDRRFIPDGLPEQLDKSHNELISAAFDDMSGRIDVDEFENAFYLLQEFNDALSKGDEASAAKTMKFVGDAKDDSETLQACFDIMESKLSEREEKQRETMLESMLEAI
jgi:MoxR-like ATPase